MPLSKDRFPRQFTQLMDMPYSMLNDAEVAMLDLVIHARRDAIKAGWTKEREAEARGVSLKLKRD